MNNLPVKVACGAILLPLASASVPDQLCKPSLELCPFTFVKHDDMENHGPVGPIPRLTHEVAMSTATSAAAIAPIPFKWTPPKA